VDIVADSLLYPIAPIVTAMSNEYENMRTADIVAEALLTKSSLLEK